MTRRRRRGEEGVRADEMKFSSGKEKVFCGGNFCPLRPHCLSVFCTRRLFSAPLHHQHLSKRHERSTQRCSIQILEVSPRRRHSKEASFESLASLASTPLAFLASVLVLAAAFGCHRFVVLERLFFSAKLHVLPPVYVSYC